MQVTGDPMPEIRWYKDGTFIDINRYPRFSSISTESSVSRPIFIEGFIRLFVHELKYIQYVLNYRFGKS